MLETSLYTRATMKVITPHQTPLKGKHIFIDIAIIDNSG